MYAIRSYYGHFLLLNSHKMTVRTSPTMVNAMLLTAPGSAQPIAGTPLISSNGFGIYGITIQRIHLSVLLQELKGSQVVRCNSGRVAVDDRARHIRPPGAEMIGGFEHDDPVDRRVSYNFV